MGKNTLWLLLARVGTQGLMVIFTILLARRLGEVGLGQYAFMASAIYFGNVLTTFGTDMLLIREIAARRDFSCLPAALLLQLALSLPLILIAFLFAPVLPNQTTEAVRALQLFSLSLLPLAFYTVFSAALRGLERMDSFTLLNLATAFTQVAALWFFIQPGTSIVNLAWLLLLIQLFAALLAGGLCLAQIPGIWKVWSVSKPAVLTLLRASAPIALLGLLGVLYQRLNLYMLATMDGAAATGLFSAAMRIVELPKIGHVALLGALFPAMAQANQSSAPAQDLRPYQRVFAVSWKLLLLLSALAAAALFLLAEPLVSLLYGAAFQPSVAALQILAWTLIPYTISLYLSSALLAAGRERQIRVALFAGLLTLLLLDVWWIPSLGILGASWAALLAECVQAVVFLFIMKHNSVSRD